MLDRRGEDRGVARGLERDLQQLDWARSDVEREGPFFD
jgi:hypothetical protein